MHLHTNSLSKTQDLKAYINTHPAIDEMFGMRSVLPGPWKLDALYRKGYKVHDSTMALFEDSIQDLPSYLLTMEWVQLIVILRNTERKNMRLWDTYMLYGADHSTTAKPCIRRLPSCSCATEAAFPSLQKTWRGR